MVWLVRRLVRCPPPGRCAHQEEGINWKPQAQRKSCVAEHTVFRDRGQVLQPAAYNHPWLQHVLHPVMSMLAAAQTDIMTLLSGDLKEALKRFDETPNVGSMGMFTSHPATLEQACGCSRMSPPWSSTALLTEWDTSPWNRNFICSSPACLPKNSENCGKQHRPAPASTTGIGQGSKIYVVFLNLFAAFSTTSDKRKVLQMADAFSYNGRGFKATWNDLMQFFEILDHTAMTTASHLYIHHRSEQWSDAKKIDFAINMCIELNKTWVLAAMTRPGAENITMIVSVGKYLSTHVPEDGPVGDRDAVHALTRSQGGSPIQCFGCQETGHVVTNCPHWLRVQVL